MADDLNAEWFAIYVETPHAIRLSETARDRIARTLRLAEELGARTVTLSGHSVAETVLTYAHSHNVTKLIAGKSVGSRWKEFFKGSIVDQLMQRSENIDVYVISSRPDSITPVEKTDRQSHLHWANLVQSLILVLGVTLVGLPIHKIVNPTNLVMLYLLAVVVAATRWGRAASVFTAVLSVLTFDFFFVAPHLTFEVANAQYLLTLLGFFAVSLVISTLAVRVRDQVEAAQHRQLQTMALYELSRDLATKKGRQAILQASVAQIEQTFGCETAFFLPEVDELNAQATSEGFKSSPEHRSGVDWVFRHGQVAGWGTETLSGHTARYLPLKTAQGVVGVVAVQFPRPLQELHPEQRRLLEAFASQIALAIESAQLAEKAQQTQLLHETEKLQKALLNSVSHDLRTPLASITGTLSSLRDDARYLDEATRGELVETAYDEAERLNQLVGNLLNMTRLEAGALRLTQQATDIQDIVGVTLAQMGKRLQSRQVDVHVPADLPPVEVDIVLIAQALVNVVDNAVKYSPSDTPIEIRARCDKINVYIEVQDRGMGIPPEDLSNIFDKFYRAKRVRDVGGTGLGLSISKGIIEAHHGTIEAANREGGGVIVTITLPVANLERER